MRRRTARPLLPGLAVGAVLAAACLGRLPHDRVTREIVLAPGAISDLPLHEHRPYWLLRDLPRWCGAFEARWGGNGEDRAVLMARAARFRDEGAAARALNRLTPQYLGTVFRERILDGPWPVPVTLPLSVDAVRTDEFAVRMQPDENGRPFVGQYVAVRRGKALILTESLGLGPEELASVLDAMLRAAERAQDGC